MITVACVLRSGGIYDAEWVGKLQRGVARHLSIAHRFVCLSDVDVPCERIPLETSWPRWWSKIELFRPGLFDGPVLYFDLDTVVVGSLDAIAIWQHRFTMAHEFYRPALRCSTAMAWHGDYSHIWRAFAAAPERMQLRYDVETRRERPMRIGDQAFIEDHANVDIATFADLFGGYAVSSYKVHRCSAAPPKGAAVVAFHGKPKPHEITTGWVPTAWH